VRAQALLGEAGLAERGLYRDDDGTLWFGAGSTLVRRRQGRWHFFTAADGLPGDAIYQPLSDRKGFLWLATSRGLVRLEKRQLEQIAAGQRVRVTAVSFDTSEDRRELAARRSRSPGAWRASNGRLWFATMRGAASIDPGRVPVNLLPPPVVIEKAVVNGRAVRPPGQNTFPPGPGNLEFHFAGVTLVEPQKAAHSYRLRGFDRDWIEAGARRVAYYTNIPPGRYRFEVRASNADGIWNQSGAALELRLLPHFYRTTGFYLVVAMVVLAVGLALYRLRLGRLRGQFLAVFAERNRMARELHDSLLQGMAAAALEIGNVRDQIGPGPAASRLEVVENVLSASLVETRRLVWNLRDGAGPSEDLGQTLWRLAARLSEGRPVTCTMDAQGRARPLPQLVQTGLFRVAQEALTNAIKHAGATRIDLRLIYEPEAVVLSVIDDGRGFDVERVADDRPGHFGLLGMRERARTLGAELAVTSREGRGTAVILRLCTNGKGAVDV
jgi:signal transduction histidine kinase